MNYAPGTTFQAEIITALLNPYPPLPGDNNGLAFLNTFHAQVLPLIPLARRVGLSAVAAAYDRGLQVAVLRS